MAGPGKIRAKPHTKIAELIGERDVIVLLTIPYRQQAAVRALLEGTGHVEIEPALRELLTFLTTTDELAALRERGLQMNHEFGRLLAESYSEAVQSFHKVAAERLTKYLIDRGIE